MEQSEIEKEYNRVKHSLEVLGYRGPLGIESAGVVNKVLNDLIKTTEAFKKLQDERNKLKSELKSQGDLVLPLRNENLKLTKENNDLHSQMIKLKDDIDIKQGSRANAITTLENEKEELKFLITQKDEKIKSLESQSEALRSKLNDMFNKTCMGEGPRSEVNPKGLTSKMTTASSSSIRRPNFEMSERVMSSNTIDGDLISKFREEIEHANLSKEDWANDLKIADEQAEKLRNEIRKLREENKNIQSEMEAMRNKLSSREAEISRLQCNNFVGDDNKEELKMKYNAETVLAQNEKLQSQIEFLNKENHRLHEIDYFHNHRCREEEVKRLDDVIAQLTKENTKLKSDIQKWQNANNTETNTTIITQGGTAIRTKSKAKEEIASLNEQIIKLRNANKDIMSDLDATRLKLKTANEETLQAKEDLNTQISSFNSERLALNKSKDDLNKKIDELTKQNSNLKIELENAKRSLDDVKNELNLYRSNELMSNKHIEANSESVKKVYDEYTNVKNRLRELQANYDSLLSQKKEVDDAYDLLKDENANIKQTNESLSSSLSKLQKEIDDKNILISSYEGKNNGLRRTCEVFKGEDYFGTITLQNCYRSRIAERALKM